MHLVDLLFDFLLLMALIGGVIVPLTVSIVGSCVDWLSEGNHWYD